MDIERLVGTDRPNHHVIALDKPIGPGLKIEQHGGMGKGTKIDDAGAAAIAKEFLKPLQFFNRHIAPQTDTDGMGHRRSDTGKDGGTTGEWRDSETGDGIYRSPGDSDDARTLGCLQTGGEIHIGA